MITLGEVYEILTNKKKREHFRELLNEFPISLREKKVILYRFGLDDGLTHTLEETGKLFGVTRERIRQIEVKTLEKMRIFEGQKLSTVKLLDKELTGSIIDTARMPEGNEGETGGSPE